MGLINPKPRFGYDPEHNQVYDYVAQRDVPLGLYEAKDGMWDLHEVKRLILAGQPIEAARSEVEAKEEGVANLKVIPPASPAGTPAAPTPGAGSPPVEPLHGNVGLSVAQLLALKLSPLQAAALAISPTQMTATGVTALQVEGWDMNAERADALKLTPEQRAVLLP